MYLQLFPPSLAPVPAGAVSIVRVNYGWGGWQVKLGPLAFTFGWRRRA